MDIYFAVTAPGIEALTVLELSRLGLIPAQALPAVKESAPGPLGAPVKPRPFDELLHFRGDLASLYRANLHLRTASRLLVRLGMPFLARTFPELLEKASRLPWERFLTPGQPVTLRVTCHRSKLYHSEAVAERLLNAIEARLGRPVTRVRGRLAEAEESDSPPQLILARLADDMCTVSLDSSGALLHRRGYRLAAAKAPLRETLAAAVLLASGWDLRSPLLDPFCGSGTIPIEAALLAGGFPPGLRRRFAFMDWPGFDAALWQQIHSAAQPTAPAMPLILGSDRDAGAIRLAQENAERAGLAGYITFKTQAVSYSQPPVATRTSLGPATGWVVTNPPYGLRISPGKDLRNLYAQFGNTLRAHFPNWRVAILSSDEYLPGHTGLSLKTTLRFANGGLQVRLACGFVR